MLMASPSSSVPTSPCSPSPSSSAISIIRPGKSILKRPPPPQRGFFSLSTLSKFLPSNPSPSPSNGPFSDHRDTPLKRAHFILPQMSTVYPISSANPPYTPNLKEEKRGIEEREAERRRRIVRSNSLLDSPQKAEDEWWDMDKVETFYKECCAGREEPVNSNVSAALRHAGTTSPRSLDVSGIQLTPYSAAALSDILTVEWGLRKLVLRECDLNAMTLKPLLHALLITNSLLFFSVASNRGLKTPAFKFVGAYVSKAKTLQYLDLSQNALDKKSVEYVVSSLGSIPPSTPGSPKIEQTPSQPISPLLSLRLDDCSLRPAALEALAHAVRTSALRNISLRHNRISATGTVALALMIKDYPDSLPNAMTWSSTSLAPTTPPAAHPPTLSPSPSTPPSATTQKLKTPISPPPRHPNAIASTPQTTYTPYIPKSRRTAAARTSSNPNSPTAISFGDNVPLITSSAQGGVTTRHPPPRITTSQPASVAKPALHDQGPSAALLDKVRALDNLPRLGALRTLDLRGNDIRGGITYIAQVLKRNRTLKLLNLSENKIDVQGLVHLAEALKYNSSLETLDLSKNPCCGPGLEGIQSLRTAFTLNTSLKRLFLSSTSLTSAGAIALAEFLPESISLLHLDLTVNNLDHAGVLALSVGLKANFTMRCLDLNIPADNEDMARLCREILNWCVRNTEEAEKHARAAGTEGGGGRGTGKGVWGMIEESELAKSVRSSDDPRSDNDILSLARTYKKQLEDWLSRTDPPSFTNLPPDIDPLLVRRTKELLPSLVALIQSSEPSEMEEMLELNDTLTSLLEHFSLDSSSLEGGLPAPESGQAQVSVQDRPPVSHRLSGSGSNMLGLENGHADATAADTLVDIPEQMSEAEQRLSPFAPKIDKGKKKAEKEASPVLQKLIMSPSFSVGDSDEAEEDDELLDDDGNRISLPSPTDRSRSWVEEEGEIFRKGQVLLSQEEMESEFAGEELRQGLLEAQVERPPARQLDLEERDPFEPDGPLSPQDETDSVEQLPSPTTPAPRPYLPRKRSTSLDNTKP